MNYRERLRKAIECPQFGNINYGEYGALRLEQRENIKRLLDEMDGADEVIKNQFFKIERLKQGYCELKEKCNRGECDCTHEEYDEMCKQNMKMDLEIERLNKGLEYIELYWSNREEYEKNELLRQIRDKDTSIEWLERAIEEEKKRERLH